MKNVTRSVLFVIFLCFFGSVYAQNSKELSPGYYIVVGAYAKTRENIAQNYVEVLNRRGFKAEYGFNASRKLYFVYLEYFTDLKESLYEMKNTRAKGEFTDAWVRVIPGDIVKSKQLKELVKEKPAEIKEPQKVSEVKGSVDEPKQEPPVVEQKAEEIIKENDPIKQFSPMTLGNTEVFLSLYNATNNRIVDGDVQVVDTERSRLMTKVKGNEYLLLPDPKSKSGQLTLIGEVFGYRKIQHEINYPLPLADTVKDYIDLMGTTLVVNFDMIRYHRGERATLYNVYFYNDASVMLPESKYELNNLLQMMQENMKYKIRLHGHTNGNYHGKIISMGPEKSFFTLENTTSGVGTAKDLSRQRAEIIREYLVSNGINPSRIEVKAWGGKRPIYDKHSVNAKKNVRVEVEILEE